jgi:hypothetical protein
VPGPTARLGLENPEKGSFDWEDAWYNNDLKLDNNPGVAICTVATLPTSNWVGRVVYVSDIDAYLYWDGTGFRSIQSYAFFQTSVFGRIAGRYYTSVTTGDVGNLAISADYLYAIPFIAPVSEAFDRIGIYVETGAPGAARLGVYKNSGKYPGACFLDAGVVYVTSSGAKEIIIDKSLAGLYWLVVVSEVGITIKSSSSPLFDVFGATAPGSNAATGLRHSFAYGNLPDPFPLSEPDYITGNFPHVYMRKA